MIPKTNASEDLQATRKLIQTTIDDSYGKRLEKSFCVPGECQCDECVDHTGEWEDYATAAGLDN